MEVARDDWYMNSVNNAAALTNVRVDSKAGWEVSWYLKREMKYREMKSRQHKYESKYLHGWPYLYMEWHLYGQSNGK